MAKNKAAVELGRKGGQARAQKLNAAERAESARNAAATRWAGHTAISRKRTKKEGPK